MRVDERIKGPDAAPAVSVVHWGGRIGDEWMMQSGAPVFAKGERVLLFLRRNASGEWTTYGLSLGVFRFGAKTLSRGDEIVGWDESRAVHVERAREEGAFLDYVRGITRGEECSSDYFASSATASAVTTHATFTSGSYTGRLNEPDTPLRRTGNAMTVSWRLLGTVAGLDLVRATDAGNAAWNEQSSLIHYSRSAIPASGGRIGDDAEHRIVANDPFGEAEGSCCTGAIAYAWWFGGGTHSFNGETFRTIDHADIVINDGVSSANLDQQELDTVMTHELGHTLGLRHSDQNNALFTNCTAPRDCCVNTLDGANCRAVMNSTVIPGITGLQHWDRKAIDCVYHANCASTAACNPQEILSQPADRTLTSGLSASLRVIVSGTPPLSYQWYAGVAGDMSAPTGGNSPHLPVGPQSTASYWVRATDPCGNHDPAGTGTGIMVAPTATTTYWGTVSNACGEVPMRTATVYVTQPNNPARGRSSRH